MGFYYEHSGSNTFLTYKLESGEELDSFNYGMLSNNSIENIIPAIFLREGQDALIRYNVSSKITIDDYFSGIVQKNRVMTALRSMADAVIASEDYMLDTSLFVLDKSYIFVDVATGKIEMICLPVEGYSNKTDFSVFMKEILFTLKFDTTEDNSYVADLISYINNTSNFSMTEFKSVIAQIKKSNTENRTAKAAPPMPKSVEKPIAKPSTEKSHTVKTEKLPTQAQTAAETQTTGEYKAFAAASENKEKASQDKFKIPERKNKKTQKEKKNASAENNTEEEKITFFSLMTSFSKERLEEYKRQKSQAQNSSGAVVTMPDSKRQENKKEDIGRGFEVPGASAPPISKGTRKNEQKTVRKSEQVQIPRQVQPAAFEKNEQPKAVFNPQIHSSSADFGKTEYWNDDIFEKTILIDSLQDEAEESQAELSPRLIRKTTGEEIMIDKSPFRIGKQQGFVDYVISGNMAISGCHASISVEGTKCAIKDTNSKNHVFINGQRIENDILFEINHQDIIRLANEDFEFRKY